MPKHFDVVLILWKKPGSPVAEHSSSAEIGLGVLLTYIDAVSFASPFKTICTPHMMRSPSSVLKDDHVYDGNQWTRFDPIDLSATTLHACRVGFQRTAPSIRASNSRSVILGESKIE